MRILLWISVMLLAGCAGGLVEEQPAELYYDLDYPPTPLDCPQHFDQGISVQHLSAAAPFDRTQMVVAEPGQQVEFSGGHQWVATPGRLVAERLERDLSAGGIFPRVAAAGIPADDLLAFTGRIYKFVWQRGDSGPRALLEAEISLADFRTREVLLRQTYRLESPPARDDDAAAFALTMSQLVQDLSVKVQKDLCETAGTRDEGRE